MHRLAKPAYWVTGTAGSNPALSAIRSTRSTTNGLRRAPQQGIPPARPHRAGNEGRRTPASGATHRPPTAPTETDEAAAHKLAGQDRFNEEPLRMWGIFPYRVCCLPSVGAWPTSRRTRRRDWRWAAVCVAEPGEGPIEGRTRRRSHNNPIKNRGQRRAGLVRSRSSRLSRGEHFDSQPARFHIVAAFEEYGPLIRA